MSDQQLQTSSQDVERIRDIIFGTQMRDYQDRFVAVQEELVRLRQDLDQLAERLVQQDGSQGEKLDALRLETRQATEALRDELHDRAQKLGAEKVQRTDLGQLLLQIGKHLTEGGSFPDILEHPAEGEE
jgi:DNA anti-recombination protein RmuC